MAAALVRGRRRRLRLHAQLRPGRLVRPDRRRRAARLARPASRCRTSSPRPRPRTWPTWPRSRPTRHARWARTRPRSTRCTTASRPTSTPSGGTRRVGYYRENATQPLVQSMQILPLAFGLVPAGAAARAAGEAGLRRAGHPRGPPDDRHRRLALDLPGAAAGRRGGRAGRGQGGVHDRPADDLPELRPLGRRLGWTSLGEYWEASSRTRNHHMFGSIGQWFYEGLAGHRADSRPGYEEIAFKPLIAEDAGSTRASASYDSVRGTVKSAWRRRRAASSSTSPSRPNATGRVYVPGTDPAKVGEVGSRHAADRARRAGRVARRRDRATGRVTRSARAPTRSASARACSRRPRSTGTVGGTVPATLSLSLGAPASFGAVHAGRGEGVHGVDVRDRDLAPRVTRRCR